MTSLRIIAAVLILAIAAQPVAALAMPCCCQQADSSSQKPCCEQHKAAAKPAAKACCAKRVVEGPKLRSGCCCASEPSPANLPAPERATKVSYEQLFTTPALLPTVFADSAWPESHAPSVRISAVPPSVNVLHCTWQI